MVLFFSCGTTSKLISKNNVGIVRIKFFKKAAEVDDTIRVFYFAKVDSAKEIVYYYFSPVGSVSKNYKRNGSLNYRVTDGKNPEVGLSSLDELVFSSFKTLINFLGIKDAWKIDNRKGFTMFYNLGRL